MKDLELITELRKAPPDPTHRRKAILGDVEVNWESKVSESGPLGRESAEYKLTVTFGSTFNVCPQNNLREALRSGGQSVVRSICRQLFGDLWAELGYLESIVSREVADPERAYEFKARINNIFEATGGRL